MLADLDFRSNSIGFLRFLFAAIVLWSHSYGIGGFGYDPIGKLSNHELIAGLLAVGGFFVLSGFLITRSYDTLDSPFVYLWHRFLRIYPAFWVCLIVTSVALAPIAFVREHHTLVGYFAKPDAPWTYVTKNALLFINQPNIRSVLANVPAPFLLNGSLWTLQWEFLCYVCVAILGIFTMLRKTRTAVGILAISTFALYVILVWQHTAHGMPTILDTLSLFVYFSLGSCAYLFRDVIPMRGSIAVCCTLALFAGLPTRLGACVAILCISYLTMYGAMKLPFKNFDRRMDLLTVSTFMHSRFSSCSCSTAPPRSVSRRCFYWRSLSFWRSLW